MTRFPLPSRKTMPFDPYALCPGGREKKIRFCCPNMLKEIEQVGRLLESNQTGACLSYIESLEKDHPNCACLTKAKLSVYRSENRWQEALPVAEQFLAHEPDNPTAAAEYALALVITGNPKLALSTLVDAFERTKADSVHSTLLNASLQVGVYLLLGGFVLPAIAIGNVLKEIPSIAEQANMFLYRATSEASFPLLLRDWTFDFDCPENFPGKETFEELTVLVRLMCWKQALAKLETLTHYTDAWSGIARNIATLHLWLMDIEKGCEALKTYTSLPQTPLEDAVDAENVRLLFTSVDTFGDRTDWLTAEYTLADSEQALEKLLSTPHFYHVDVPDRSLSPPPRGCFVLLDRPFPDSEAVLTTENAASQQAIAILYGKETDREARLFVQSFAADDQEIVETKIREALGDLVQFPGNVIDRKATSRTRILLQCRFCFPQKQDIHEESVKKLVDDYYTTVFPEQWLTLPLGLFDGKTPGEAAKESKYTIPLLAVIQMIDSWIHGETGLSVTQDLRTRLGLPVLDTITVTEGSGNDPLSVLDAYPVGRWYRFDVSKLSTEVLADGLQIVSSMREQRATVRFAQELLNRPMDSMPFPVRVMAFESLITVAQAEEHFEEALLWLERAKAETVAQNVPDAAWYLHEITLQLLQQNGQAAYDAIQYLTTNYRNDANVMQSLQELLTQLGFFNQDGTPSAALSRAMAETKQQSGEQQRIWTPDDNTSPGSATSSKLWVPD